MPRTSLHGLLAIAAPLVAVPLLGLSGCDDYYAEPPPATAVNVNATAVPGDPAQGQPTQVEAQGDTYADTDPSALTDFRSTLDPHGQWVEDPTYGTVWTPNAAEVGADFSPYETAGHWAYDDDDYVWVSDYDWGWAPFHYGRWVMSSGGWVWIPGRDYAGAWVDWQMGAPGWGYVGWGPMYPGFIWRAGFPVGYVAINAPGHFYYCAHGDVFAPNIGAHVVVGAQAAAIGGHMTGYGGGGVGVAGGARVGAAPGVAGPGVAAGARVHGPAPASLGIAAQNVPHVPPGDRGMAMAKGFSKPSTATKLGAHAPVKHSVRPAPAAKPRGGVRAPSRGGGFHGRR